MIIYLIAAKVSPTSGYLTRQISFLLNNYKFDEGEDKTNEGLMIPRYVATGRTAPDGKVYAPVIKQNEDDLVPVRSIITKKDGELTVVTPDLLSKRFLKTDISYGSAIGLSLGTSLTENITQSLLGLKHGGHERVLDKQGNLYAPKDCEIKEEGRWIILKVRGGELKYPRPSNWVGMGKQKYAEGEIVGSAYNTTSPTYKLGAITKLLQAKGGNGTKYFEKDNIIISDCYSYDDGQIHYIEDKNGEIEVMIGNRRYMYCDQAVYYYPDGTQIKKYQRICSGVVNMRQISDDFGKDINSIFNIFRRQFYTLLVPGYLNNGCVSQKDLQEEIVEITFAGLTNQIRNEKNKLEEVDYLGTQNAILSRKSFFTTLSYGWSSKAIGKALKGDLNIEGDIMTETVLGLLLNDKLDNRVDKK